MSTESESKTACVSSSNRHGHPRSSRTGDGSWPPSTGSPVTILLVDDHDAVRRMCRSALEENGYRVLEADNSLEALLIATSAKDAVNLVITEVAMPQISGAELGR